MNTQRATPISPSSNPGPKEGRSFEPAAGRSQKPAAKPDPVTADASKKNPFASWAPAMATAVLGDNNGETKHYEVPRELIEIARAKAKASVTKGALTPIVPPPTPDLDAGVKAYTAPIAKSDSGLTERLVSEVVAAQPRDEPEIVHHEASLDGVEEDEPAHSDVVVRDAAAPADATNPAAATSELPNFRAGRSSGKWLIGAGIAVTLSYYAQALLAAL